jgi:TRAP transporter TAXI family solute receptor
MNGQAKRPVSISNDTRIERCSKEPMNKLNDAKLFIKGHLWLIPIVLGAIGLFFWALDPAPPNHLKMATGSTGGGYTDFGERLKARLAEEDVTLELVPTTGSPENVQRLLKRDVQIALVQSGTELDIDPPERSQLTGLGVMYREPLWLFQRADLDIRDIADLRGLRVGLGSDGSGTLVAVEALIAANAMEQEQGWQPRGGDDAAAALEAGELDAAFFVAPPQNPLIKRLAASAQLRLVGFERGEAYRAHFPFLTSVHVPEGLIDLANNSPARDITTLSPLATLVANNTLHPALTPLILEAARDVLKEGNLLDEANTYPKAEPMTFRLAKEADNYYRNGPPYLQRYLPFKVASLVDRWIVLLIPFIAILLPLFKSLSPLYTWRIRSRIYSWYQNLRDVEDEIHKGTIAGKEEERLAELKRVEDELSEVEVPLSYSHELYQLHLHVRYMQDRLKALRDGRAKGLASADTEPMGTE